MRKIKIFILISLGGLLGFSSADSIKYVVVYDESSFDSISVFSEVELYSISRGFVITEKIEEIHPEKRIVSYLSNGKPSNGGVSLTLTHFENGGIEITGFRLSPGCSPSKKIETMNVLKENLQEHLRTKFGSQMKIVENNF